MKKATKSKSAITEIVDKINDHTKGNAIEKTLFIKKIPRDPGHNSKIDYQRLTALLAEKRSP